MKTLTQSLIVAMAVFLASSASAFDGTYTAGAGINDTAHDLSTPKNGMSYPQPAGDTLNRICIFCHAPHNTYRLSTATGGGGPQAPDAYDYLPLWNHELTGNYASYTMYQNGSGAPTVGLKASQAIQNGMQPGSTSLLCLSCHDGSVAVNSYGNASQQDATPNTGPSIPWSQGSATIGSQYVIGKDNYLGNHHPIGFNYDAVSDVDTEIRSADSASFGGTAGLVRDHLLGADNTQMECGTCHSVHNTGNSGETLLWRSDVNSELCLTCHAKGSDPNQ